MFKTAKSIAFWGIFICIVLLVFYYARGYRFNTKDKSLVPSGIVTFSSSPKGAKVYIDSILKGATEFNMQLPVGNYSILLEKEGYNPISKQITVQKEIVFPLDGLLIPKNPSFTPLTNIGVQKVVQLKKSDSLLLFTDKTKYATNEALYSYNLKSSILNINKSIYPLVNKNFFLGMNPQESIITESPLGDQLLLEDKTKTVLLQSDTINISPLSLDKTKANLVEAWKQTLASSEAKLLETFPTFFTKKDSVEIIDVSPDKTKLLYKARIDGQLERIISPPLPKTYLGIEERMIKKNTYYVYDKKEDKSFVVNLPKDSEYVQWYIDSARIFYTNKKSIYSILYDDTENQLVYSGPYENNFFAITGDGNLVILINLNPVNNRLGDLYKLVIR
jgi:hypothetical protein